MLRSCPARVPSLILALTLALPVTALADDGSPADETICDELQDATPGLYGLCIAYCEAQDCDGDDFDSMQCDPRKQSVLDNYNRKRTEADPEMPCAQTVEPDACPCFDRADLEALQLEVCRNTTRDGVTTITANGPACLDGPWFDFVGASDDVIVGGTGAQNTCFIRNVDEVSCDFQVATPAPEDITQEQASACFQLLQQYLQDIALTCN